MASAFPLTWPLGHPRTRSRKRSQFSSTSVTARDGLLDELRRLGASQIVVSSNVATYERGGRQVMYADQAQAKSDPGVAVYFFWKGEQYVFASDRWDRVQDNVQAIRKTIEALRGIDRWGTGDAMRAAFTGFKALPAPGTTQGRAWWEILGVAASASETAIQTAYRTLAHAAHPDRGGTRAAWDELAEARRQGLAARGAR